MAVYFTLDFIERYNYLNYYVFLVEKGMFYLYDRIIVSMMFSHVDEIDVHNYQMF